MTHRFYLGFTLVCLSFLLSACSNEFSSKGFKNSGSKGIQSFLHSRPNIKHGKHVVKTGETLQVIAKQIGVKPEQLAKINHINYPYVIYPGQTLYFSERSKYRGERRLSPKSKDMVFKDGKKIHWGWPIKGITMRSYANNSKGLDVGGQLGTPVRAAAKGIVVYSGHALKGYGKFIIIKHNENFLSAYAHNQEIMVKEGDHVNLGQEIAKMGKSDSEKVKLHFEIRYKGKEIDPLPLLPKV